MDSPGSPVWRWNRDALWDWQWSLLYGRTSTLSGGPFDLLTPAARVFAQPRPESAIVLTPEEILSLKNDPTGAAFANLNDRLQFPSGPARPLSIDSLAISTVDGAEAYLHLVTTSQGYDYLYATRRAGAQWLFAGALIVGGYTDRTAFNLLETDSTIGEIRLDYALSGIDNQWQNVAWVQVDERGLHCVHWWIAGQHIGPSGSPIAGLDIECEEPEVKTDTRGRFIDQMLTVSINNDRVIWTSDVGTAADRAAVADLGTVFARSGRIRYRWNATLGRFAFSRNESEWNESQIGGWSYWNGVDKDAVFITQNFDTLVNLATGDDPARRAWVRLVLTRLADGAAKSRLQRAIAEASR